MDAGRNAGLRSCAVRYLSVWLHGMKHETETRDFGFPGRLLYLVGYSTLSKIKLRNVQYTAKLRLFILLVFGED